MTAPKYLIVDGDGKIEDVTIDAEDAIDTAFKLGAMYRVIPMAEAFVSFGVNVAQSVYMERMASLKPTFMPPQRVLHKTIKDHQDNGFTMKIQFIKDIRAVTSLGLADAKGYVDWVVAGRGPVL